MNFEKATGNQIHQLINEYIRLLKKTRRTVVDFSVFSCGRQDAVFFNDKLKSAGYKPYLISVSQFRGKSKTLKNKFSKYDHIIINLDILPGELKKKIADDGGDIIAKFLISGKTLSVFALYPEKDYLFALDASLLHEAQHKIESALKAEQIIRFAELSNIKFDADELRKSGFSDLHRHNLQDKFSPTITENNSRHFPLDADLDSDQLEAVESLSGPVRVMAPAGSGKTKTLINHLINLLNNGIADESVLSLAFNRKAAKEMRRRLIDKGVPVSTRIGDKGVTATTMHGLGYQIIRKALGWTFRDEKSETEVRRTLKMAVNKFSEIGPAGNQDTLETYRYWFRKVKTELLPLKIQELDGVRKDTFRKIFEEYLRLQKDNALLSYDDMIYLALRILLENISLRRFFQNQFKYLLVDEFQDLNAAQHLFVSIIAMPQNNLFVVGDDDQMIYGWRGADVNYMLDFEKKYPDAQTCVLGRNYRSSPDIVYHSKYLIGHNRRRIKKDIRPKLRAAEGTLDIKLYHSIIKQAEAAATLINGMHSRQKLKFSDFAVLYRYHSYQFILSSVFDRAHIPHTSVDERLLFRSQAGQDLYAYLIVLVQPEMAAPKVLKRILKRPNKFMSSHLISNINTPEDLINAQKLTEVSENDKKRLEKFTGEIIALTEISHKKGVSPVRLIAEIGRRFKLKEFYDQLVTIKDEVDYAGERINFEIIESLAANFDNIDAFFHHIKWAVNSEIEKDVITSHPVNDEVHFTTIHSTKGNEYKNVVLFNLSENSLPQDEKLLEEERRVAYVGVTRAIDSIFITAPRKRFSPFLKEIALNPEFADYTLKDLQKMISNQEKKINTLHARLNKLILKNDDLTNKYHKKEQKSAASSKILFARDEKIANKIKETSQKIFDVRDSQIPALKEYIRQIEKELHFRKLIQIS